MVGVCQILNPDMCYFIGVAFGDGSIRQDRIRVTVKDYNFIWNVSRVLKRLFKRNFIPENETIKGRKYYSIRFYSTKIAKIIKQQGLEDIERETDLTCIGSFLSGCFDSEGCVDKHRFQIRLLVRNKRYIEVVSHCLNKLEIKHALKKNRNDYVISIYGKENISRFSEFVSFSVKKRRERLKNLLLREIKKRSPAYHKYTIVPHEKNSLKKLRKELIKQSSILHFLR